MLRANISTYVFTLIEITIVHVLFHTFTSHHLLTHHSDAWIVVLVVICIHIIQSICICYVLSMNASSTFDHWKLLSIEVFVWIWCKSSSMNLFVEYFVLSSRRQIRKLLLSFSKFFIVLFLIRVNAFDLICWSYLYLGSMSSHIFGMLTILTKRVWEGCSHATLS